MSTNPTVKVQPVGFYDQDTKFFEAMAACVMHANAVVCDRKRQKEEVKNKLKVIKDEEDACVMYGNAFVFDRKREIEELKNKLKVIEDEEDRATKYSQHMTAHMEYMIYLTDPDKDKKIFPKMCFMPIPLTHFLKKATVEAIHPLDLGKHLGLTAEDIDLMKQETHFFILEALNDSGFASSKAFSTYIQDLASADLFADSSFKVSSAYTNKNFCERTTAELLKIYLGLIDFNSKIGGFRFGFK